MRSEDGGAGEKGGGVGMNDGGRDFLSPSRRRG